MRWLELSVTTSPQSSEAVAAKLLELGAGGVSFEENWDWDKAARLGLGDIFPIGSGQKENIVVIRGYLPLSFLGRQKTTRLGEFLSGLQGFGLAPASLSSREVDDSLWNEAWKQYWQPTAVGEKLLIVPSWHEAPSDPRLTLLLDPGPAFGTGTHESTRLCLELLEGQIRNSDSMLDIGCGSGILALAARLLGARAVWGVDRDEAAVRFSRENAVLNGLDAVTFMEADLNSASCWRILPKVDLVAANLTADLLLLFRDNLRGVLLPLGRIIVSGIIRQRLDEVKESFVHAGFVLTEEKSDGEWSALLLELK
ncbi:MAG: 50S ribosomal protein L11 methyltransferase [Dethiobacter sp.]|nr:50S ribosomal protein L11 methyltransferase [Dethiobacter sp.]